MTNPSPAIEVVEVLDPQELARARRQREDFDRNSAWLQAHISEAYADNRGLYICVAGQELFVAARVQDAIAQATTPHPDDEGWFTRYIPKVRVARVYAAARISGGSAGQRRGVAVGRISRRHWGGPDCA